MTRVQMPSVQLSDVREDYTDAIQGAVIGGEATFDLEDGWTLEVAVDGGGTQTVTFSLVDIADIDAVTMAEALLIINAGLTGATATDEGGFLTITTDTYGAGGSVQIVGGTARAALGFALETGTGTDATDLHHILNRIPEAGEEQVGLSDDIQVDIYEAFSGGAPAATEADIYVNGVLVWDGSGTATYQAGWTGSFSIRAGTRHFFFRPDTPFPPDTEITVRAVFGPLDESWTFTTLDTVSPVMESVTALGKRTVRVVFNEPVLQADTTASDDALNPANYSLAAVTDGLLPVAGSDVISVETVAEDTVELTLSDTLTFGATYQLTASNIEDDYGNAIAHALQFEAYTPPFPDGRRFLLAEMLPDINWWEDAAIGDLAKMVAVLQEITNVLLCMIDEFGDILDPNTAPIEYIDAMLLDLGNPFDFSGELEEVDRRRLLGVLIDIYKQKGTEVGIINVIRFFLGIEVTIDVYNSTGWILGVDELGEGTTLFPGALYDIYSYAIDSPVDLTAEQALQMGQIAEYMQPAHVHLRGIRQPSTIPTFDHVELGVSRLGSTWILH